MVEHTQSFYTGICLSPPATQLGWYERQEATKSSKIFDRVSWFGCYLKGYREPNYPVPTIPTDIEYFFHPLQSDNTHIAIYRRRYRKRLVIWYKQR
jgi:hypothetical protein